jgi:hypothetical protein
MPAFPRRSPALKSEMQPARATEQQSTLQGDCVLTWRHGEMWKLKPGGKWKRLRDVEAVKEK